MLTRRELLARHEWPNDASSELRFSRLVFRDPQVTAGIVGQIGDAPRIHHLERERAGYRY